MRRRDVLKSIGASSVAVLGATGLSTAERDELYVVTEIDGESQQLTLEEFDQHPETKSLSEVSLQSSCSYECCECCELCCPDELCPCGGYCGYCNETC